MNVEELRSIAERFETDRMFRQIVQRPLVKEMRLTNRDQVAALSEHVERSKPINPLVSALMGIPIYLDAGVPLGVVQLVFEDGSERNFRLT